MSALRALIGALALLLAMPTPWCGQAQAQSASERSLARQLFRQGVSSAREGEWEVACERFQRAYELDPRPVTLLNYAGALVQTGRLVEGAEGYRSFLASDTSGSAERLRGEAERLLAEVEPRIPRLQLAILGIEATDVVRLDEWEISHAALELGLPVDPGEHVVQVSRGTDTRELAFSVAEGETEALEVDLRGVASARMKRYAGGKRFCVMCVCASG